MKCHNDGDIAAHNWRGTPWEERTPERRAQLKRTNWWMITEALLIGGTIAVSLTLGLWSLIKHWF